MNVAHDQAKAEVGAVKTIKLPKFVRHEIARKAVDELVAALESTTRELESEIAENERLREVIARRGEAVTIREAFAKAGCPVHETAWLVYWPLPNVSDKAWFMLDHNDPKGACFYWLAHGEWHPVTDHFDFDESDLLRGQVYESIDIGDLPVTKFIETLLPVEWLGHYDQAKAEVGS